MSQPVPLLRARRSRRGLSVALAFLVIFTAGFSLRGRLLAYLLNGSRWPSNADIVMNLQLGADTPGFFDGAASWNQSAEDALSLWNQNLGSGVRFAAARNSAVPLLKGDRKNSVFFGDDVFGEPFGDDVLAVTLRRYSNGLNTEADVVFNAAQRFNSYRGPLRPDNRGGTLYDFHRVALHEFGHVLGLSHPDDDGQRVVAVMNSRVSNTDALQADDLAGIRAIYGSGSGDPTVPLVPVPTPSPAPTPTPTPTPTPIVRSVFSVVGDPARGGFVITRTGNTDSISTFLFHNGGSAVRGEDYYPLPNLWTFTPGQTEAVIPITLLPTANRNHKVKLFLDPGGSSYDIGKAQSKLFLSDLP